MSIEHEPFEVSEARIKFAESGWEGFKQNNGSPEFYKLLEEIKEIHDRKSHDYASNQNPFGNYYFAGQLSLLFKHSFEDAGFVGRIGEKIYRLANLESNGLQPKNESVEDTERDICTIVALWIASRRERRRIQKL